MERKPNPTKSTTPELNNTSILFITNHQPAPHTSLNKTRLLFTTPRTSNYPYTSFIIYFSFNLVFCLPRLLYRLLQLPQLLFDIELNLRAPLTNHWSLLFKITGHFRVFWTEPNKDGPITRSQCKVHWVHHHHLPTALLNGTPDQKLKQYCLGPCVVQLHHLSTVIKEIHRLTARGHFRSPLAYQLLFREYHTCLYTHL